MIMVMTIVKVIVAGDQKRLQNICAWDWMSRATKTCRLYIYSLENVVWFFFIFIVYFHLYLYLFLYLDWLSCGRRRSAVHLQFRRCTFPIPLENTLKEIDMPFVLESVLFKNEWYFCERHVCDSSNLKDIPKFSSLFQFITSAINILKTNDQILIFRFLDKHWTFQVSSLLQSKAALADLKGTQSAFCYSYLLVKCSSSMEVKNILVSKPTLV